MSEENAEERARRKREERREEREERRAEQELRRSALRKIAGYLGFADLMAVLMVLATGFSAFATWRTATIAYELLTSSERPYFGVRDVTLDRSHPDEPRIYVDYRNFGHVPADNVRRQAARRRGRDAQCRRALARRSASYLSTRPAAERARYSCRARQAAGASQR